MTTNRVRKDSLNRTGFCSQAGVIAVQHQSTTPFDILLPDGNEDPQVLETPVDISQQRDDPATQYRVELDQVL